MALKDWKKRSSLSWDNSKLKRSLIVSERFRFGEQKFHYTVLVNDHPPNFKRHVEKEFKSRTKALKFARQYMRTH